MAVDEYILAYAFGGNLPKVEWLVGHDPGLLNARDEAGRTPLMWAFKGGHLDVARWLLDQGAAINERTNDGCTALWCACEEGDLPVMRLLLERGADPTTANQKGSTPLLIASSQGHLEVVRGLLGHPSANATIDHGNELGQTALWLACCYGRGGIVRVLLKQERGRPNHRR
jgi:uncharacterized protein